MGKYRIHLGPPDLMGEGSSSICRKGTSVETGEAVAIKVYKDKQSDDCDFVKLKKFKKQVSVLQELAQPFQKPANQTYWHHDLEQLKPNKVFMKLIDYSTTADGELGPDPKDGILYVVTELAQYNLKDILSRCREHGQFFTLEKVKRFVKSIVSVMAALHAKGWVHLDFKPENIMIFNGRLKVIDVDGCLRMGGHANMQDDTISFSPCYCAPEWACFLIEKSELESSMEISSSLDVWSIGMTLCELVTLKPIMAPMFVRFAKEAGSPREASFLFLQWVSSIKEVPIPRDVDRFSREFGGFIRTCFFASEPKQRYTCAQLLDHPFLSAKRRSDSTDESSSLWHRAALLEGASTRDPLGPPHRAEAAPFHGTLWRLSPAANIRDPNAWVKSDMWIASNGALCYFSIQNNSCKVLIDAAALSKSTFARFEGGWKSIAFELKVKPEAEPEKNGDAEPIVLGCDSETEYEQWATNLKRSRELLDDRICTIRLGPNFVEEVRTFKLKVKNRRMQIEDSSRAQFVPIFKGTLWKVKAEGDRMQEQDWFEREMWIAANGSLVYWSKKESRELVYYTAADIADANFAKIPNSESFKPWTFQIKLRPQDGVEFMPGEFAALSEEQREAWLSALRSCSSNQD